VLKLVRRTAAMLRDGIGTLRLGRPSSRERGLISELREEFAALRPMQASGNSAAEAEWVRHVNRLRQLVLTANPRRFLRWDVILETMFVHRAAYTAAELAFLQSRPSWPNQWRPAVEESPVGDPPRYPPYPASSGNLIHHAHHVARFEDSTGLRVQDMSAVVEFGGGYGSMCRLLLNLGFRGRYWIYDLPLFSALQRYYLGSLGFTVTEPESYTGTDYAVHCVSDRQRLPAHPSVETGRGRLFMATWSLSETPRDVREQLLPLVEDFDAFLIAYQFRFGEVDNVSFFREWTDKLKGRHAWYEEDIPGLAGHRYLFGKKKSCLATGGNAGTRTA
jgi:hypothetical protein